MFLWRNNWQSIFDVVEIPCYNHFYSFLGRCDSWSNSGKLFVWIGPLAIVTRSQWPSLPTDNWSKFLLLWQKLEITKKNIHLTHNMQLIHTSFTYSKLNMDEICSLKLYSLHVHTSQFFFWNSSMRKAFFRSALLAKLNWDSQLSWLEKGLAHGGTLKIFFLDHFSASYLGQKY